MVIIKGFRFQHVIASRRCSSGGVAISGLWAVRCKLKDCFGGTAPPCNDINNQI